MAKTITVKSLVRVSSFKHFGIESLTVVKSEQFSSPTSPGDDSCVMTLTASGNSDVLMYIELLDKLGAQVADAYGKKSAAGVAAKIMLADDAGVAQASASDAQTASPPVIGWRVDNTDFSTGTMRATISGKYDQLTVLVTVKKTATQTDTTKYVISGGGIHVVDIPIEVTGV